MADDSDASPDRRQPRSYLSSHAGSVNRPGASPAPLPLPALLGGEPADPAGPPVWPPSRVDVLEAVTRAARDGAWGRYDGPWSEELRGLLAAHHRVSRVELVASGTLGVEMALEAAGVGPGDEVVLSAYDFRGNPSAVLRLGALPVLVDVAADRFTPEPAACLAALSARTKAVLVSHLHGDLADLATLAGELSSRGVTLVEDACQMPGAWSGGAPTGSFGAVAVLSFGGSKLIASGRGGAVLTGDPAIAARLNRIAWRGNAVGPMSELQAAALIPQWRTLNADHRLRLENVRRLLGELAAVPGFRVRLDRASLAEPAVTKASDEPARRANPPAPEPTHPPNTLPGFYKLGFEFMADELPGVSRAVWIRALRAEGIAIDEGFRAAHRSMARSRFRAAGSLPEADRLDERATVLHHPVLTATPERIARLALGFRKVAGHAESLARFPG